MMMRHGCYLMLCFAACVVLFPCKVLPDYVYQGNKIVFIYKFIIYVFRGHLNSFKVPQKVCEFSTDSDPHPSTLGETRNFGQLIALSYNCLMQNQWTPTQKMGLPKLDFTYYWP